MALSAHKPQLVIILKWIFLSVVMFDCSETFSQPSYNACLADAVEFCRKGQIYIKQLYSGLFFTEEEAKEIYGLPDDFYLSSKEICDITKENIEGKMNSMGVGHTIYIDGLQSDYHFMERDSNSGHSIYQEDIDQEPEITYETNRWFKISFPSTSKVLAIRLESPRFWRPAILYSNWIDFPKGALRDDALFCTYKFHLGWDGVDFSPSTDDWRRVSLGDIGYVPYGAFCRASVNPEYGQFCTEEFVWESKEHAMLDHNACQEDEHDDRSYFCPTCKYHRAPRCVRKQDEFFMVIQDTCSDQKVYQFLYLGRCLNSEGRKGTGAVCSVEKMGHTVLVEDSPYSTRKDCKDAAKNQCDWLQSLTLLQFLSQTTFMSFDKNTYCISRH